MINGAPIIAVATGLTKASQNSKTGAMIQVYILRSDRSPLVAINEGSDEAICGTCPLRGQIIDGINKYRACYVSVRNAPRSIYFAYLNNRYPKFKIAEHRDIFIGRLLRLSAYGDPTAVPPEIWEELLSLVDSHTGYTHMWRTADVKFKAFLMASVHSQSEALEARASGWRYFRSKSPGDEAIKGEFYCPAAEGRKTYGKVTCSTCLSCSGITKNLGKFNPIIDYHGGKAVESGYLRTFKIDEQAPQVTLPPS